LDQGKGKIQLSRDSPRVGIVTGLVGDDLIGHGSAQEQSVVGETPNLAARCKRWPSPAPSS
jgi:hypothetical protein